MLSELRRIAAEAGGLVLRYLPDHARYGPMAYFSKQDGSPVCDSDVAAHEFICRKLNAMDKNIPIISEEDKTIPSFEIRSKWQKFWLVDPIDASKEYLRQNIDFTVNIALIENGVSTAGVIYAPARRVMYSAANGQGSWRQQFCCINHEEPQRIWRNEINQTTPKVRLTFSKAENIAHVKSLIPKSFEIDACYPLSSSLKFCWLAEGKVDFYPRCLPYFEWDVAAGDVISKNAVAHGAPFSSPFLFNAKDLRHTDAFVIGLS